MSTNHKLHAIDIRTVLGPDVPQVCCGAAIVEPGGDTGAALEEARRMRSVFIDVAESLAYSQV
jgi:hypothetical protein